MFVGNSTPQRQPKFPKSYWRSRGFLSFTFRIINAKIVHEIQYFTREPASSGIILNSFFLCILLIFFFLTILRHHAIVPTEIKFRFFGENFWALSHAALVNWAAVFFILVVLRRDSCMPSLFALLAISAIPIWIWGKDFSGFGSIADFWS
ncbi:hypothetical protein CEXT_615001 [Caerostris extrusa]|uniref:Uncharacterized protein n=1 Tax=Caerostris extrusa TaxID=172846 RepID=A0AAV4RT39_CAEEX|nr:hypothetical protein CEXT_615001 [Caerostris extrusa]